MPATPRPIGSPNDIVIYDGRPHSRAYAVADMAACGIPAAWVERTMAEAPVVAFGNYKPCHDEKGWFTPCDSGGAAKGEAARDERRKALAGEKGEAEKAKAEKAVAKLEKARAKVATARQMKQVAREIDAIKAERTFPPEKGAPVQKTNPTVDSDGDGVVDGARVGVGGRDVPPPPQVPRMPNLTADERLVEERFANWYERDPDAAAKKFMDAMVGDYEKNRGDPRNAGKAVMPPTFETDAAKNLCPDYHSKDASPEQNSLNKGLYNVATHQVANAVCKKAFVQYLDEVVSKLPPEKKNVLVTSGGCGSGKGWAVGNACKHLNDTTVAAVWDAAGEQNATENPWILDECKKRGIKPTFVYVHADPSTSWEDPKGGVVERAKGKGRMVDARLFADSYAMGAKNFQGFMDKHKDSGDADFVVLDNNVNRGKKDEAGNPLPPVKLDKLPDAALKLDADQLYQRSASYIKKTAGLTPGIYRGASLSQRIWDGQK